MESEEEEKRKLSLNEPESLLRRCKRKRKKSKSCKHPNPLCASKGRKALVCADTAKRVSVDQLLNHQHVALFLVELVNDNHLPSLPPLIRVYSQLLKRYPGQFEIVFVAVFSEDEIEHLRAQQLFDIHLSRMPWPALPFDDPSKWRQHISSRYNEHWQRHGNDAMMMIFDKSNRCLNEDALHDLLLFGPDYFPFTEDRVTEIQTLYNTIFKPFSLQVLLASQTPHRDYLITSSAGDDFYDKVPISLLQGKVVGLFFFHGYPHPADEDRDRLFMEKLHSCHTRAKGDFQVIFINLEFDNGHQSEQSFHAFLSKYPWLLALPFKDNQIRPLSYLLDFEFSADFANRLVILSGGNAAHSSDPYGYNMEIDFRDRVVNLVGDNDTFCFDPFGYNIIEVYGFEAYPFSREKVIECEMNKFTRLKLADVFETIGAEFLIRPGTREKIHVSSLKGKRVLLYPTEVLDIEKIQALEKKDKSLIIVALSDSTESKFITQLSTMPKNWLAFRSHGFPCLMFRKLKLFICVEVMAFDESGIFVTMGWLDTIPTNDPDDFPFISHNSCYEAFREGFIRYWLREVEHRFYSN